MAEKMTLEQVRDELREQAEFARGCGWPMTKTQCLKMADAIDANLTQQAQAVDVGAIREVIAYLKVGHKFDKDMADKLTRAIGNAQADD